MSTPIYNLTEWAGPQASPWVPHNEALRALEAVARGSVADRDLTAPPIACDDGACYLIAAAATGAWATFDGKMAVAVGTDAASGWIILTIATEGQVLWVEDEALRIQFTGGAWDVFPVGGTAAGLDYDADAALGGAGASDGKLPTQLAVKTYVDGAVAGGGVSDGDKGDITVSGSGSTFTIDPDAVTYAKMQDISATARVLGRKTAGAGDPEELTLSEVLDLIGTAAQGDILYRGVAGWARLAAGTSGHFLKTQGAGADPLWADAGGGGGGSVSVTTQTGTSYTFAIGDADSVVQFDNAAAITATIPPDSSVAFPVGTFIELHQLDAGTVTVVGDTGVSLLSRGSLADLAGQEAVAGIRKVAADTWRLTGDIA